MTQKTKKKILEVLEGYKKFNVSYYEEVAYSKVFKAKSEEELREKFDNGELEFDDGKDIIDGTFIEDSLEIEKV